MGSELETRVRWAQDLLATGRPAESLIICDQLLTEAPRYPAARETRAWALSALNHGTDAIRQAELSVSYDPYSAHTHLQLATLLFRHQSEQYYLQYAVRQAEMARDIDPENPHALVLLARLAVRTATPQRAEEYLQIGLTRYPQHPDLLREAATRAHFPPIVQPNTETSTGWTLSSTLPTMVTPEVLGKVLQSARHACWLPVGLAGLYMIAGTTRNPLVIIPAFLVAMVLLLISSVPASQTDSEIPEDLLAQELRARPRFAVARNVSTAACSLASIGLFLFLIPFPMAGIVGVCILFLVGLVGLIAVQIANRAALQGYREYQREIVRRGSARATFAVIMLLLAPIAAYFWAPSVLEPWITAASGTLLLMWGLIMFSRDWLQEFGVRRAALGRVSHALLGSTGNTVGAVTALFKLIYYIGFEIFRLGLPLLLILIALHP